MSKVLISYSSEIGVLIEKTLQLGETLSVGRDPGGNGIALDEAAETISRESIEIELVKRGVSIYNSNKFDSVLVEVGQVGKSLQNLRRGVTSVIPFDGRIVIEGTHRVDFTLDAGNDFPKPEPDPEEGVTRAPRAQTAWDKLHENYQKVCIALVAAWHVRDFKDIKYRTVPTNFQVACLLSVTEKAANNKIDRTKETISDVTEIEFSGEHGKSELADWIDMHNLVTSEMVDSLPGLKSIPRHSDPT